MSADDQNVRSIDEGFARERIAQLERALRVSEQCLITLAKTLRNEGYSESATSTEGLIGIIHDILDDKPPPRKLH